MNDKEQPIAEAKAEAEAIMQADIAKPRDIAWALATLIAIEDGAYEHGEAHYRRIKNVLGWIDGLGLQTRTADGLPSQAYRGVPVAGFSNDDCLLVKLSDVKTHADKASTRWPNGQNKTGTPTKVIHKTQTRRHELESVIELAQTKAVKPDDYLAVWPELRKLAMDEVAPFTGDVFKGKLSYTNGKNEIAHFSKRALKGFMQHREQTSNDH